MGAFEQLFRVGRVDLNKKNSNALGVARGVAWGGGDVEASI